jgi:hypothetical protein
VTIIYLPPLLVLCRSYWYAAAMVQRCNGTTAGLGYLEVNVICPCKSPHWAIVDPIGENGTIPMLNLTLTTIFKASIQSSLQTTLPCNPQAKLLYVKCTRLNKNEWH